MKLCLCSFFFFFSSRRRHTRLQGDWSSDVCSSDLDHDRQGLQAAENRPRPLALGRRRDLHRVLPPDRGAALCGAAVVVIPEVLFGAFLAGAEQPHPRPLPLHLHLPEPHSLGVEHPDPFLRQRDADHARDFRHLLDRRQDQAPRALAPRQCRLAAYGFSGTRGDIVEEPAPGENVASLPMVFPGLVLGLSIMIFYLNFDIGIYGTIWIMFIAYITR